MEASRLDLEPEVEGDWDGLQWSRGCTCTVFLHCRTNDFLASTGHGTKVKGRVVLLARHLHLHLHHITSTTWNNEGIIQGSTEQSGLL